jgi:hypothetical protein
MRHVGVATVLVIGSMAAAGTTAVIEAATAVGSDAPPAGERTDPRVHPGSGTRHTAFAVRFTLRHTAGHQGYVSSYYHVAVTPPAHSRSACAPQPPPAVMSGDAGARLRVRLRAPKDGWCAGRYTATVYFQRGPYCGNTPGKGSFVCPRFVTQDVDTGSTRFTVHSSRR